MDFEVRIGKSGRNYELCVSYIGNDAEVMKLMLEKIPRYLSSYSRKLFNAGSFCMFYISMLCKPSKFTAAIDDRTLDVSGDAVVTSFYNRSYMYDLDSHPVFQKLKGIGQRMMCLLVQTALSDGALKETSKIVLEASGHLDHKDMIGLVRNYERLGFNVIYPEYLEESLEYTDVPMEGTVRDILSRCLPPDTNQVSVQLVKGARRSAISEADSGE